MTVRLRSSYLAVAISAVVFLASCGGGAKSESDANTGAIAFNLTWPGSANVSSKPSSEEDQVSQAVSCAATGIDTIYAEVWDGNTGQFLNVSATFLCSFGQGTLSGVTAGTNRLVRMFGKDAGGTTLYRGTQSGISVTAGATSAAGSISMSSLSSELDSIAITPASPSITVAATQQMTATGTYTDASTGDITSSVTWNSSETGAATITSDGLVTGVGAGTSVISATSGMVFTSTVVTVAAGSVTLTSIAVTPATATLASISATQQLTATATYDDASTPDITSSATWSSSDDAVASVSSSGLVTAIGNGSATITATLGSVTSNSVAITVTATATLSSIAVTPATVTIDEGATQAFMATGTYSDSSTLDLTSSATWTSSVATAATIADSGIATGTGLGIIPDPADDTATISTNETTITATIGALTPATATLTVRPLPLAPTNVSATAGDQLATVSWDAATGATSYNIYWATSSGVTTSGGTSVTGVTSPYSHTSLTGGTTYYYIVTAVSDGTSDSDTVKYSVGEGDASSEVSATPTDSGAPSVSGTTPTNDTTPTWTWTTSGGSDNYRYKLDDSDLANGATSTTGTSYTATTLAEGDHTLYVQEDMTGSWSPTGSYTITVDTTAPTDPGSPSDAGVYTTSTTVTFDWTTSTDGETSVASYTLQVNTASDFSGTDRYNATVGNVLTYDVTGVDGDTLYARVLAVDAAGNSSGWVVSDGITIDTTAPSTPGTPSDAGTHTPSTTVTFTWATSTDTGSGIASYTLQVNTASDFSGTDRYNATVGDVLTYDVTGVDGETLYARVYAVNGTGASTVSAGVSDGILIDTSGPGVSGTPTDAGTYSSSTTVAFTWTAATDAESGIDSYNVQVGTTAGGNDIFDGSSGTNSYSATGSNGQTLYARVQAVNGAGTSGSWSSNSDGITIDTTAPSAPGTPTDGGGVLNVIAATTATFSWAAATDSGSGVASYTLQVYTNSLFTGGTYRYNATVGNVTTYSITGVDGDDLYARIYAVNGVGTVGTASGTSDGVRITVGADTTRPLVSPPTSPADTATGVLLNSTISVTFNEAMDTATITGTTFTVSGGVTGTIAFSNANQTATLTPSANLTSGTVYTVTITTGVADTSANSLAINNTWTFTAGSNKWGEMIWGEDKWGP